MIFIDNCISYVEVNWFCVFISIFLLSFLSLLQVFRGNTESMMHALETDFLTFITSVPFSLLQYIVNGKQHITAIKKEIRGDILYFQMEQIYKLLDVD